MGCACLAQKELVKQKDVDLSCDITNPYLKESNDTINFKKNITEDIFKEKREISQNLIELNDTNDIVLNKKSKKKKIKSEPAFCGPIINMLRRQVDKYNKKNIV
jgi:hypothetical protein